jgi:hypothetical protein
MPEMLVTMPVVRAILGFLAYVCAGGVFAAAGDVYAFSLALGATALSSDTQAQIVSSDAQIVGSPASPAYPLKASSNNRYLVDQNNVPFLVVGDAPQTLIANLSEADATKYMANRAQYGINALWINLLCNYSDGCKKDASTFDSISPFTVVGDLSSPNAVYFRRVDDMINIAVTYGMVVLLDPIETSSWLDVLRANGTAKAFEYGQWLGNRYKKFPNIIWMHGNDFQTWKNAADDALVQAVARGIRSGDPFHIHTIELNYKASGSLDDPTWAPLIELDAAYTYFPTYAQVLTEYNRPDFKPVFMVEANYEFEHLQDTDGGSTQNLRRQEYWTMLSGASGQLYGSRYTWRFDEGWQTKLDTPGAIQLGYMKNLFASRKWYDLVPDQNHTIVTAGYDGLAGNIGKLWTYFGSSSRLRRLFSHVTSLGSITANTYATAAGTSDGTLLIVYMPSTRTITVDMSKLAGVTVGLWYDPTSGSYTEVGGSPFANSGTRQFTPPGTNQAGDGDWILVLEPSPPH